MGGVAGKSGPKKGNLNSVRNGSKITRLTLGSLPRTMLRQTRQACKYRRELEGLVFQAKGEVNSTDAHLIDEAASAEIHSSVCRWLLREKLSTMSVSDILKCSSEMLKAKTIRNRAVERLQIDRDTMEATRIESLYADAVVIDGGATE